MPEQGPASVLLLVLYSFSLLFLVYTYWGWNEDIAFQEAS